MFKPLSLVSLFLAAALLSACGSFAQPYPIGIGRDADALKRSECACQLVQSGWL